VLAAFDARMGEVYWGAFVLAESSCMEAVVAECVAAPDRVSAPGGPAGEPWYGAGQGWEVSEAKLRGAAGVAVGGVDSGLYPRARDVAVLAAAKLASGYPGVPAAQALPVYLRDRVVQSGPVSGRP